MKTNLIILSKSFLLEFSILTCLADKTIEGDDSDSNDVYETIEFSDSSSNVYTEPVRDYGVLRKVNIKTSPTKPPSQISGNKKPPSGLKKSSGSRNLQKHKALHDVSETANEDIEIEPSVELRLKPHRAANTEVLTSKHDNSLISVGLRKIILIVMQRNNYYIDISGCRSAIYSHRKFGQIYPTTRCFGYLNQFRMFKIKVKK